MSRSRAPDRLHHKRLNATDFDLDIQELITVSIKHLLEVRQFAIFACTARLQMLESMPAQDKSIQFGIVAQNGVSVASAPDIEFKAISPVGKRQVKSSNRVFRCVPAGATVAEK